MTKLTRVVLTVILAGTMYTELAHAKGFGGGFAAGALTGVVLTSAATSNRGDRGESRALDRENRELNRRYEEQAEENRRLKRKLAQQEEEDEAPARKQNKKSNRKKRQQSEEDNE